MTQKFFVVLLIVLLAVVLTSGCIINGEYPLLGSANLPRHLAVGDQTVCINVAEGNKFEINSEAISIPPSQRPSSTAMEEIRLNEAIVQNCTGW